MVDHALTLQERFVRFSAEVLRWNERFSLISRIEPERRLELLVDECRAAWDVLHGSSGLLASEGTPQSLLMVDLGTGGGFPGLVWHLLSWESGRKDFRETLCFEPREKRAWFLDHCARLLGCERFSVVQAAWDVRTPSAERLPADLTGLERVVISMKALRLTDQEVLSAWRRFAGPGPRPSIWIVRFVGEGFQLDAEAKKSLALPPAIHSDVEPASRLFSFQASGLEYGLLLSEYPPETLD